MNHLDILLSSINLIYRESKFKDSKDNNSIDLVRNVLNIITEDKKFLLNNKNDAIENLKKFILDMCNNGVNEEYDAGLILQSINLIIPEDKETIELFKENLLTKESPEESRARINRLRRFLKSYHKDFSIKKILNKYSFEFSNNRGRIKNTEEFISNLVLELDEVAVGDSLKDPSIVDEIDIDNHDELSDVFGKIKDERKLGGIFRTGWQALNRLMQGKRNLSITTAV